MKKLTDQELGVVIPDTFLNVLQDETYSDDFVGKLVRAIIWTGMDTHSDDPVITALVRALYPHYVAVNKRRMHNIERTRERKRNNEAKKREMIKKENGRTWTDMDENGGKGKGREGKEREDNNPVAPCGATGSHTTEYQREVTVEEDKAPDGWTVEKLVSMAKVTYCPEIPEKFVREFWQRMVESGWREASGRKVTGNTIRVLLSKWWAAERKYMKKDAAAQEDEDEARAARAREIDCSLVVI